MNIIFNTIFSANLFYSHLQFVLKMIHYPSQSCSHFWSPFFCCCCQNISAKSYGNSFSYDLFWLDQTKKCWPTEIKKLWQTDWLTQLILINTCHRGTTISTNIDMTVLAIKDRTALIVGILKSIRNNERNIKLVLNRFLC